MRRFVVTGTDTGVGKTVVAAALAGHLGVPYWKPVQAGLDDGTDREIVAALSGQQVLPEAYRLTTPCSPHQAAALDGVAIDPARLLPPAGPLVIEGAGGVLVPLSETLLYADLFARWSLPVVLVARTALGTINHSLLSLEALRARDVPIAGIAFVGDENAETERVICAVGQVRRLGRLPWLNPLAAASLRTAFAANFDLDAFA
ncbi:MAG: dethiobiotin synthase [Novosphingobium sp.]